MEPKYHPFEVHDLCPYCWRHPCICVHHPIDTPFDAVMSYCQHCATKDKEIEKLKNLLSLAGVGY